MSLAGHLLRCQAFDNFLATKFQSVKRFIILILTIIIVTVFIIMFVIIMKTNIISIIIIIRYGGEGAEAMMGFFTELN